MSILRRVLNIPSQFTMIGNLGNIFKPPKVPEIILPGETGAVAAPTVDAASQNRDQMDKVRRRKGRLSTIMTGMQGDTSNPLVGTKSLLGQ